MHPLLQTALAGTSRVGDAAILADDSPPAALVEGAGVSDRERKLLLRAGTEAIYRIAGRQPGPVSEAVEPAGPESSHVASDRLAGFVQQAMAAGDKLLLADFLRQLHAAQCLLPPEILPQLLDTTDSSLRVAILPLLGERGRWLSRFRDSWSWAQVASAADADNGNRESWLEHWEEGSLENRRTALAGLRRVVPDEARQLLSEAWKTEKAEARAELLSTFAIGLSADDEPFCETALDDRAASVRQAAAELLSRLPGSALVARMIERAEAMLAGKMTGLIRKKLALSCSPPTEIDKTWERDGIAAKPAGNVGKRAYWATCVLASVRPTHWSDRFQSPASSLIAAIASDDYADAVLDGWTQATVRFPASELSAPWPLALAEHWRAQLPTCKDDAVNRILERLEMLIAQLNRDNAEGIVTAAFEMDVARQAAVFNRLLPRLRGPWSGEFGRRFLRDATRAVRESDDDRAWTWANSFELAAVSLPAELLTAETDTWEVRPGESWRNREIARAVERFVERVRLRRSFGEMLRSEAATGSHRPAS